MRRIATLFWALLLAACNADNVSPDRVPRFAAPNGNFHPKVALVLGSGGPRGFAHIGVLKVLEEAGIRPDLIVGSSVGAMVGALYANGMSAAELEREAYQLNVLAFFEFKMLGGKLSSGAMTQTWVNERVDHKPLEQLPTPLVVAATRASDRKLVLFNQGDTGLAVRASSASPGQFDPVRIGDAVYIDGDEASPVPIRAAKSLGAHFVIAIDVSAYASTTPPGVPQEWIAKDSRRAKQIEAEASEADVMLHPDIGYYAGQNEEYRRRVIGAAERYAREQLPKIREAYAKAGMPVPIAQKVSTTRSPAGEASR